MTYMLAPVSGARTGALPDRDVVPFNRAWPYGNWLFAGFPISGEKRKPTLYDGAPHNLGIGLRWQEAHWLNGFRMPERSKKLSRE